MKKSKSIISALLTLVMVMSVLPLSAVQSFAVENGDYEYSILSETDKTCSITNYTGLAEELSIPSSIDGYKVVSIGNFAFDDCTSLCSVIIPESVTTIGRYVFYYCSSLTNITLPNSIINIKDHAFSNTAYYNTSSNWENGVLYIGNHLIESKSQFSGSYQVKYGTKTISDDAISHCPSLTEVIIPDSVTSIGASNFAYCKALTSVTIGSGVTIIWDYAFKDCTPLTTIHGNCGTYAEVFAEKNGLTFIPISEEITQGDLNGDGNVSIEDYALIKDLIFKLELSADILAACDLNGDGVIDAFDISLLDLKIIK